jgi:hypothetical protein
MGFSSYFADPNTANSETGQALQRFLNDNPYGVRIGNGYRTPDHQASIIQNKLKSTLGPEAANRWAADVQSMGPEAAGTQWEPQLRASGISKWVALPGRSNHQKDGGAFDLEYTNDDAKKWAHENAARYGFKFPMAHEPWHLEPIAGGTVVNTADTKTSAPPSQGDTVASKDNKSGDPSTPSINPITGDTTYAAPSKGGGSPPPNQAAFNIFGDPLPQTQRDMIYGTNTYGTNTYGTNFNGSASTSSPGIASLLLGGFNV